MHTHIYKTLVAFMSKSRFIQIPIWNFQYNLIFQTCLLTIKKAMFDSYYSKLLFDSYYSKPPSSVLERKQRKLEFAK